MIVRIFYKKKKKTYDIFEVLPFFKILDPEILQL